VVNLAGAFVAAGLAALVSWRSVGLPWAAGTAWYLVLFILPTTLHDVPATLPGEVVSPQPYSMALAALACSGCAAAGIGTAAGIGLTRSVGVMHGLARRPSGGKGTSWVTSWGSRLEPDLDARLRGGPGRALRKPYWRPDRRPASAWPGHVPSGHPT